MHQQTPCSTSHYTSAPVNVTSFPAVAMLWRHSPLIVDHVTSLCRDRVCRSLRMTSSHVVAAASTLIPSARQMFYSPFRLQLNVAVSYCPECERLLQTIAPSVTKMQTTWEAETNITSCCHVNIIHSSPVTRPRNLIISYSLLVRSTVSEAAYQSKLLRDARRRWKLFVQRWRGTDEWSTRKSRDAAVGAESAPLVSRWVTRQHLTAHSASCGSRW